MGPLSESEIPRRRALESNFHVLAEKNVEFKNEWSKISKKQTMESQVTPSFQLSLTRALLDHHFGLTLKQIPPRRLIPPVPNRWFYVEWLLQELLPMLTNNLYFHSKHIYLNRGLDIGTGASCIYPLLATKKYSSLYMVATDIDPESIQSSVTNVEANGLVDRVQVLQVDPSHSQHPSDSSGGPVACSIEKLPHDTQFDFCMTNPPFFDTTPCPRADGRDRSPMTDSEGMYPGGEVGFVLDMIQDSLRFQQQIGWYSTMLGKKCSLTYLKKVLGELLGIGRVQTTEFKAGTMTRWFLAWTYHTPALTSPAALVRRSGIALHGFCVKLLDATDPVQIVVSRFCDFFHSIPTTKCKIECRTCEENNNHVLIMVTETNTSCDELPTKDLPERITKGLELSSIHPFSTIKDFFIEVTIRRYKSSQDEVYVSFVSYKHMSRNKVLEKVTSQAMEGEIRQTNRKWRRMLQRQLESCI